MSKLKFWKTQSVFVYMICIIAMILSMSQKAWASCEGGYNCIGMTIDSGDPVLIQMGNEMSGMVSGNEEGVLVKPTEGPIANVRRVLSKENAGLTCLLICCYTQHVKQPEI